MSEQPHLRRPSSRYRLSFVDAVAEFGEEGPSGRTRSDQDLSAYDDWSAPAGFDSYVRAITELALDEAELPAGLVPSTRLWWTRGDDFLGRLDVRHTLTPALLEVGGHVGYAVRPACRRQGHATAMLAEGLVVARALGLERVLVTTDVDNVGSRRVITKNGGELEDQRGQKLRYWIET